MKYWPLLWGNLTRHKTRTVFTLLSAVAAFLLFGMLMSVRTAFTAGVSLAGADRLVTMNSISLVESLPLGYRNRIRSVPGVREVSYEEWMGAYFRDPRNSIIAFAVEPQTYLDIYSDLKLSPASRAAWFGDRRGAIIGKSLATQYGWRVGEVVPLKSNLWRDAQGSNVWDVRIDGIYSATGAGQDNLLLLHYKYLDERRVQRNGRVGLFILRIGDPERAAVVADEVDALFANSPAETRTATEKAFLQSFAAQFGDIGAIVTAIVTAVLFSMLLVTANTMVQSVRERTAELAALKAIGFGDGRIAALVMAESLLLTGLGGGLGLALAWALLAVLRYSASALIELLPGLAIPPSALALGAGLIVSLGLIAGLLPAWQALRLNVASALRSA